MRNSSFLSNPFPKAFEVISQSNIDDIRSDDPNLVFFEKYPLQVPQNYCILENASYIENLNDLIESIAKMGFSFPYFFNLFEKASQTQFMNEPGIHYYQAYFLCSSISWFSYYVKTGDDANAIVVLRTLYLQSFEPFTQVFLSLFCFFYEAIIQRVPYDRISIYIELMNEFFSHLKVYPPEVTYIILKVIPRVHNDTNMNKLVYEIVINLINNHVFFPDFHFVTRSIELIYDNISKLDVFSLHYLKSVIRFSQSETLMDLFSIFPSILQGYIISHMEPLFWDGIMDHSIIVLSKSVSMEGSLGFQDSSTFKNGYPISMNIQIPKSYNVESLYSDELMGIISILLQAMEGQKNYSLVFVEGFVEIITKIADNNYLGNLFSVLFSFYNSIQIDISKSRIFLNTCLFDPTFNIIDQPHGYQYLYSLRCWALKFLLKENTDIIELVFTEWVQYPNFFYEITLFLVNNIDLLNIQISLNPKIIRFIRFSLLFLRTHNLLTQDKTDYIELARCGLLNIISSLLSNQKTCSFLFSDTMFLTSFSLLLYEEPLRVYALSHIQTALINLVQTQVLINHFEHIIASSIPQIYDLRNFGLIESIVVVIHQSYLSKNELAKNLHLVNRQLSLFLSSLPQSERSQSIFLSIIEYFTDISKHIEISSDQFSLLELTISRQCGKNPSKYVYNSLVHYVRGSNDINENPNFIIRNGPILLLMLRVFIESSILDTLLSLIYDLCKFNKQNCIICNKSEVDLFLLSLLSKSRTGQIENIMFIETILKIFKLIASSHSSAAVVKKFVSLLSPIDSNQLSSYHPLFMETLHDLIASVYWNRGLTAKLGSQIFKDIDFNTKDLLNNGFIFSGWFYFHELPPKEIIPVFSLEIDTCFIHYFFQGNSLFISHYIDDYDHAFSVPYTFETNQWIQIVILYRISKNNITLFFRSPNYETPFGSIPIFSMINQSSHIRIGCSILKKNSFIEVGTVLFSPGLNQKQINELFLITPLGSIPENLPRIASFCPGMGSQKSGFSIEDSSSFAFSLIKLWKLDIILPLFAILNHKFPNGSFWHQAPATTISILSKALLCSEDAERSFSEGNKFMIVSYLLCFYLPPILNFEMYCKFYSLYTTLMSNSLKIQLFRTILSNPEIWISTSASDHIKILSHWSTFLFPSSVPFCLQCCSIQDLLNILCLYYWYEPTLSFGVFSSNESKRPRDPDLDVTSCRIEIYKVIQCLASLSITTDDISLIFGFCQVVASDQKQVQSLLFLAEMLFQTLRMNNNQMKLTINQISPLYDLLSLNNEDITVQVFSICILMIKLEMMSTKVLTDFIDSLILYLNPGSYSIKFGQQIITKLYQSSPELLGLCCWYASNHNNSSINQSLSSALKIMTPDELYSKNSNWFIWPLVLASKSESYVRESIISFLISCSRTEINRLLCVIDIVCIALGENEDLKSMFLNDICSGMINQNDIIPQCCYYGFFLHVFFFLIFRTKQSPNQTIIDLFMNSGYSNDDFIKSNMSSNIISGFQFHSSFKDIQIDEKSYYFGYRFDSSGNWLDLNLAISCVQLVFQLNAVEFIPMASFLSSVVSNKITQFPSEVLPYLYKTDPKNPFIDLIKYRDKKSLKSSPCYVKVAVYENALSGIKKTTDLSNFILNEILTTHNDIKFLTEEIIESIGSKSMYYEELLMNARQEIVTKKHQYQRIWGRIWSGLSAEKGPWDFEDYSQKDTYRWKRDSVYNFAFCPFRMKRNIRFNNHYDASLARDNLTIPKDDVKVHDCIKKSAVFLSHDEKPNKKKNQRQIFASSQFIISYCCEIIKPTKKKLARFNLSNKAIEIVYTDGNSTTILLTQIQNIFYRTRYHQKTAIEVFTYTGKAMFVNFPNNNNMEILTVLSKLSIRNNCSVQLLSFSQYFSNTKFYDKWANGDMSNFEYLMMLNIYSGRSFLDHSQYPIFPVLYIETESTIIDFDDMHHFRDLSKPIGALNPERFTVLLEEMKERESFISEAPFLYSSGPVSRLTICIFLLRVEPYTTLHIKYQNNKFDVPDRQLCSISGFLESVTTAPNDYREIIPEFFFFPEFLTNDNQFDLGKRNGIPVNDIILPNWAISPFDFIYKSRMILESKIVSSTLSNWIDLLWGYKQRDEEINTYDAKLYEDVWDTESEGIFDKKQIKAFLRMIGQVPPQLFSAPHVAKNVSPKVKPYTEIRSLSIDSVTILYSMLHDNKIYLLTDQGQILVFEPDLDKESQSISIISHGALDIQHRCFTEMIQKRSSIGFSISGPNFVVFSDQDNQFLLINVVKVSVIVIPSPHYQITKVNGDGIWFSTSGSDSSTHLYMTNQPKQIQYSIQSYRDTMLCSCLSDTFKIHINGTRDGALVLSSLTNGVTIRVINLEGGIPLEVIVSPTWGFIIVKVIEKNSGIASKYLYVYTINGLFIRKCPIETEIIEWCTWSSRRGFDYLAALSENGKIIIYEIYFLNTTIIPGIKGSFSGFFFSRQNDSFVLIEKSGRIVLVPYIEKENW